MQVKGVRVILYSLLSAFVVVCIFILVVWHRPSEVDIRTHCDSHDKGATKVLYIGNSLTFYWDSPQKFCSIFGLLRPTTPLYVQSATGPGYTLFDHLNSERTLSALDSKKWDYVIIQEGGQSAFRRPHQSRSSHRQLVQMIQSKGAKPVIVMMPADKGEFYWQAQLSHLFRGIGAELKVPVVAYGDATFCSQIYKPQVNLYDDDNHHPSKIGSSLYACLVAQQLLRFTGVDLKKCLSSASKDQLKELTGDSVEQLADLLTRWENTSDAPQYAGITDDANGTINDFWLRQKKFDELVALYEQEYVTCQKLFGDSPVAPLASSAWRLADVLIKREREHSDQADKTVLTRACGLLQRSIDIHNKTGSNGSDLVADIEGYKRDVMLQFGLD